MSENNNDINNCHEAPDQVPSESTIHSLSVRAEEARNNILETQGFVPLQPNQVKQEDTSDDLSVGYNSDNSLSDSSEESVRSHPGYHYSYLLDRYNRSDSESEESSVNSTNIIDRAYYGSYNYLDFSDSEDEREYYTTRIRKEIVDAVLSELFISTRDPQERQFRNFILEAAHDILCESAGVYCVLPGQNLNFRPPIGIGSSPTIDISTFRRFVAVALERHTDINRFLAEEEDSDDTASTESDLTEDSGYSTSTESLAFGRGYRARHVTVTRTIPSENPNSSEEIKERIPVVEYYSSAEEEFENRIAYKRTYSEFIASNQE